MLFPAGHVADVAHIVRFEGGSVTVERFNGFAAGGLCGGRVFSGSGFVSADADHRGGWLETPPLMFKGKRLRLNIDTGGMGTAFVELRDLEGKPVPGFALADCEEVGGDFIDQTVYWRANPDVSSLEGRPVRLYFGLTRAKLYAFQFTQE